MEMQTDLLRMTRIMADNNFFSDYQHRTIKEAIEKKNPCSGGCKRNTVGNKRWLQEFNRLWGRQY